MRDPRTEVLPRASGLGPGPGGGDEPTAVHPQLAGPGRHRRGGGPEDSAIFLDGSGRRKRTLTWVLGLAAVTALVYTVALGGSMLVGADADSALPRPGETAAASSSSPAPSSASSSKSASPSSSSARGRVAQDPPARRSASSPKPSAARPTPTRSVPPPTVAPTETPAETPDSFWSRLFPSPSR